ncbi:MAG: hypothetical protein HC785_20490 [Calothrix sp. CSU_2_0]|nr:hypothetical protein [Calothrix sp. CSU_2_0]
MVPMTVISLKLYADKLGLLPQFLAQENLTALTPEQASVMFSGPKFLVALFAGLIMAIA